MRDTFVSLVLIVSLLATSSLAVGCASSTQITSEPTGAAARIDGQPIGNTPAHFSEGSVWVWTDHQVTLEKKGYQKLSSRMQATVNVPLAIIGGIGFFLCIIPGILVMVGEFEPVYHYVLRQKEVADLNQGWQEQPAVSFGE